MNPGRTRCNVNLYTAANFDSGVAGTLKRSDLAVEIIERKGKWLKVSHQPKSGNPIEGFAPVSAIARPLPNPQVLFPLLHLPGDISRLCVPVWARMADFNDWLNNGGRPAWFSEEDWQLVSPQEQQDLLDAARQVVAAQQANFAAWEMEVHRHFRAEEATMREWSVFLNGGEDVLVAVDKSPICLLPGDLSLQVRIPRQKDILRWTGLMHRDPAAQTLWCLVEGVQSTPNENPADGWIEQEALNPYIFPSKETDAENTSNKETIFDLDPQKRVFRHPTDGPRQFIDIKPVVGFNLIHGALCGEFSCAVIVGEDVIPMLKKWKDDLAQRGKKIKDILVTVDSATNQKKSRGTFQSELIDLLHVYGMQTHIFTPQRGDASLTAGRLKREIEAGRAALTGCIINGKVGPELKTSLPPDKTTFHWIVLEDVFPVGTSGWVRIYNPYMNRDEVYTLETFIESYEKFPYWLWVDNPFRLD